MLTFVTMHLGFSAEETAFAEEVRAFLRRHPPDTFPLDGMDAGYGSGAVSRAFLARARRRGLPAHGLASPLRRRGAPDDAEADPARGAGVGRRALRARSAAPTRRRRSSSATGRLPAIRGAASDRARRGDLLAGLQRARRGLGPPVAHDRGAARRRRVRHPRPQDLESHAGVATTASCWRAPAARRAAAAASPCSSSPTTRRAWTSGRSGA